MTGTAPQRPKADPQMVTCFQCRGDGTCFATDDPCPVCGGLGSITDDAAPVPQTEGECPDCEKGVVYRPVYQAGNLKADGTLTQPHEIGYVTGDGEMRCECRTCRGSGRVPVPEETPDGRTDS